MRGDDIGICVECGCFSALPVWWREGEKGHCLRCDDQTESRFYPDTNLTLSPHRLEDSVSLKQLGDDFNDPSVPIRTRIGYGES